MDKILQVMIAEMNRREYQVEELNFIFNHHPKLKQQILDTTLKLALKSNPEEKIHLPLINILLMLTHPVKRVKMMELFDNVEAFKEVYLEKGGQKLLTHGLDLFSLTSQKFTRHLEEKKTLNIQSIEQFYTMLEKGNEENPNYGFHIEPWRISKYSHIQIAFDDLFLKEQTQKDIISYSNAQFIDEENRFTISGYYHFKCSDIKQASKANLENIGKLLRHKIINENIINWDNEKLVRLMVTPNYAFTQDEESMTLIKSIISRFPEILNKEIMTICYIKHKKVYEMLLKMSAEQNLPIYEATPVYELKRIDMEQKMQSWQDYISQISLILKPHETTDSEVYEAWKKLATQIDFLKENRSHDFFQAQLEQRILVEQILSQYIPRILSHYFKIPERLRVSDKTEFKAMTLSQLKQIQTQLEEVEVKILEEDLHQMKVFGKFLDKKMPSMEEQLVKPILK